MAGCIVLLLFPVFPASEELLLGWEHIQYMPPSKKKNLGSKKEKKNIGIKYRGKS